jgi:hypothetical protein
MQVGAHHAADVVLARIGFGLQVGAQAHLETVAPQVVLVVGVHRLVHVADEVDHELERIAARLDRLAAVGEDRALGFDRRDHALAVRAVAFRQVGATLARRGVDVVPARSGLEALRIQVAQAIGPVGDAGQGGVGLARQQQLDLGFRSGSQVALGQLAHQPVAECAPGHRGRTGEQGQGEGKGDDGGFAHGTGLAGR